MHLLCMGTLLLHASMLPTNISMHPTTHVIISHETAKQPSCSPCSLRNCLSMRADAVYIWPGLPGNSKSNEIRVRGTQSLW